MAKLVYPNVNRLSLSFLSKSTYIRLKYLLLVHQVPKISLSLFLFPYEKANSTFSVVTITFTLVEDLGCVFEFIA